MQSVFSRLGSIRRKESPVAAAEAARTPPPMPSASPATPAAEATTGRDSGDALRQSTVDPRRQLQVSKALQPSDIEWVMTGKQIDKIGHGQYPIYKATVTILGKSKVMAVKAFPLDDKEDFEKEVAVQSKMLHPCLLTLIGWCEKDQMLCLVMPYKKGGDLKHLVYDMSIPLTLAVLLPIMEDVLRGLKFLHSRNILHRDLKPENILLNKSRTHAKISDFGTTRQSAQAMTVFAVGTVEYCAPEVYHSAEYDSAVDIFSLGIILWECITRTKPWAELKAPLALKVERKLTAGERPIIPEGVPALYRELITRCWAYKPEDRPTAEEILLKIIPRIKEQHCPELVVKQARPQLGMERGRAQAPLQSSPSPEPPTPTSISYSSVFVNSLAQSQPSLSASFASASIRALPERKSEDPTMASASSRSSEPSGSWIRRSRPSPSPAPLAPAPVAPTPKSGSPLPSPRPVPAAAFTLPPQSRRSMDRAAEAAPAAEQAPPAATTPPAYTSMSMPEPQLRVD